MQLTEFQKGYLSGLIDGEGSIFFSRGKYPRILVRMCDKNTIVTLKKITGLGCITLIRDKRKCMNTNRNYKTNYSWNVQSTKEIYDLAQNLTLITKKEQLKQILLFCKLKFEKKLTEQEKQKIINTVKNCNKKGEDPKTPNKSFI